MVGYGGGKLSLLKKSFVKLIGTPEAGVLRVSELRAVAQLAGTLARLSSFVPSFHGFRYTARPAIPFSLSRILLRWSPGFSPSDCNFNP